ncbi:hypothetical protein V1477_019294 [Vespula maculifrons]|uniref:Uncharacterized protein n=2 Tax=Vespula TaxID=7451 RepID=A0A834MQA3_VESGE|nr:hypothetical protein HZH68_016025 [Vespula germanica]
MPLNRPCHERTPGRLNASTLIPATTFMTTVELRGFAKLCLSDPLSEDRPLPPKQQPVLRSAKYTSEASTASTTGKILTADGTAGMKPAATKEEEDTMKDIEADHRIVVAARGRLNPWCRRCGRMAKGWQKGGERERSKTASSSAHQIIVITEYYAAVSAVQTPWPINCGYVPNMVNLNFQRFAPLDARGSS